MSASEKLRALNERLWNENQRAQHDDLYVLGRRLPQIIAALEAAEELASNIHNSERVTDLAERADAALAELEKALSDA